MSMKVAITEGEQSRNFSDVNRLAINLSDETVGYMVPESECELEPLSVSENGDYVAADEGIYGYDSVTASVTFMGEIGDIGPGPEIELGDITIEIDPITELPIVDFGDETIEITEEILDDIGLDGDVDLLFDDLGIPSIEGIDELGIETITPVTIDGLGETETLPSEIRVITNPTKTVYDEGEEIDLDGIVVQAYDALGNLWTSDDYPDGIIPVEDLTVKGVDDNYRRSDFYPDPIPAKDGITMGSMKYDVYETATRNGRTYVVATGKMQIGTSIEEATAGIEKIYDVKYENDVFLVSVEPFPEEGWEQEGGILKTVNYLNRDGDLLIILASSRCIGTYRSTTVGEFQGKLDPEYGKYASYNSVTRYCEDSPLNGINIQSRETTIAAHPGSGHTPKCALTVKFTYNGKTVYSSRFLGVRNNLSYHWVGKSGTQYSGGPSWQLTDGNLRSAYQGVEITDLGDDKPSDNHSLWLFTWTMLYGEKIGKVEIAWNRPKDNKELTTTFNVTITEEVA